MSRAQAIETRLEKLLPVLDEFFTSGFLSREEVQDVSRQRTHWEYKLVAKPLALLDVQDAVRYELGLEERLRAFCITTRLTLKYRWSILERIERIYGIGLKNLKKGNELEELRRAYVCFLQHYERGQSLSRLYAEWMIKYPTRASIWTEAAEWEGIHLNHMDNARTIVQQALVTMGSQSVVWCCALKLELHFVSHLLRGLVADVYAEKEERHDTQTATAACASLSLLPANETKASSAAHSDCISSSAVATITTTDSLKDESACSVSMLLQHRLSGENAALAAVLFDLALAKAVVTEALDSPAGDDPALVEALLDVTRGFDFAAAVQQTVMESAMGRLLPILIAHANTTTVDIHHAHRAPMGHHTTTCHGSSVHDMQASDATRTSTADTRTSQQTRVRWRQRAAHILCHHYLVTAPPPSPTTQNTRTTAAGQAESVPATGTVAAYIDHLYRELATPHESAIAHSTLLARQTDDFAAVDQAMCALLALLLFALAPTAAPLRRAVPQLSDTLISSVAERLVRAASTQSAVTAEAVSRLALLLVRSSSSSCAESKPLPSTTWAATTTRASKPAAARVSVAQIMQALYGAKVARSPARRRAVLQPAELRVRELCARFTGDSAETAQSLNIHDDPSAHSKCKQNVETMARANSRRLNEQDMPGRVNWDVPSIRRLILPTHRQRDGRGAATLSSLLLWCDDEIETALAAIAAKESTTTTTTPAVRRRCRCRLLRQAQQYGLLRIDAKSVESGGTRGLCVAPFVSETRTPLTLWRLFAAMETLSRPDAVGARNGSDTMNGNMQEREDEDSNYDDSSSNEDERNSRRAGTTRDRSSSRTPPPPRKRAHAQSSDEDCDTAPSELESSSDCDENEEGNGRGACAAGVGSEGMWKSVKSFAEAGLHFLSGVTPDSRCDTAQTEWERVTGVCGLVRARLLSVLYAMCTSAWTTEAAASSSSAAVWTESRISSLLSVSGRGWTRVGVSHILQQVRVDQSPSSAEAATMHALESLLQRLRRCLPVPRAAYARLCIPFMEGWAMTDGVSASVRNTLLSMLRQLHEETIRLYGITTHGELFVPLLYDVGDTACSHNLSSAPLGVAPITSAAAAATNTERCSRRAVVRERNTEDWLAYVSFERVVAQDLSRARAVAGRATHAALAPQQLLHQLNRV